MTCHNMLLPLSLLVFCRLGRCCITATVTYDTCIRSSAVAKNGFASFISFYATSPHDEFTNRIASHGLLIRLKLG